MYRVMLVLVAVACALGCTVCMGLTAANPPAMKVNGKDGAEMVLIPAGEFLVGTSEEELKALLPISEEEAKARRIWTDRSRGWDTLLEKRQNFVDELPQHKVYLDAYYIYKTEVTRAQYRKFCQEMGGRCRRSRSGSQRTRSRRRNMTRNPS